MKVMDQGGTTARTMETTAPSGSYVIEALLWLAAIVCLGGTLAPGFGSTLFAVGLVCAIGFIGVIRGLRFISLQLRHGEKIDRE